jgi:hypothetical protein
VSLLLEPVESRLVAVLESNRGGSGMSADAAARAIPAGWFRRVQKGAPLRDGGVPPEHFDRGYQVEWGELGGVTPERNAMDSTRLSEAVARLEVGYVYGPEWDGLIHAVPGEEASPSLSVTIARMRALSDAESRIVRALEFPEIVTGSTGGVTIFRVRRIGRTRVEDLGGGRLVATTDLAVSFQWDATQSWVP